MCGFLSTDCIESRSCRNQTGKQMDQDKRHPEAKNSQMAKAWAGAKVYWAALVAVVVAIVVFVSTAGNSSGSVWYEVAKLCAQFLILVVLGVLVSYTLDQLRARHADERAAKARQEDHVRRLIDITHDVDLARLMLFTNRSLRSWSKQMTERIIPAYTAMRNLVHDQKTALQAGSPVFKDCAKILLELLNMNEWLRRLCNEFAQQGNNLSPLARYKAWSTMRNLQFTEDLVRDGDDYGEFRDTYRSVLASMRKELSKQSLSLPKPDFTPEDVVALHALYVGIRQAASTGNHEALTGQCAEGSEGVCSDLLKRLQSSTVRSPQILSALFKNNEAILVTTAANDGQYSEEEWQFVREPTNNPWKLKAWSNERSKYEEQNQRSTSDYVELWKHHAAFGGEDKNRMVTIASFLLGVSAAILGVIVSLPMEDGQWISFQQPRQAVMFSLLGIIISGIAAYIALLYAGYSNQNWKKADDIAERYGWKDLSVPLSQAADKLRPLARISEKLARPCDPKREIAPVFAVFAALSTVFFLIHLIILIRSAFLI